MRISFMLLLFFTTLGINAQVEIYGTAKNYKDSVFYITEPGGFYNLTRVWRDNKVKVVIDKDGHFKVTIPEDAIDAWYIKTGKNPMQLFDLVKGQKLELIADFSKEYPLTAVGKNAADFNYSSFIREQIRQSGYQQKVNSKNIDSILAYRKAFSNFKMQQLAEYKRANKMSDVYFRWLNSKYTYEPYDRTVVENIKQDSLDEATLSKIIEKGIHDEYAAMNTIEYNDLINFYIGAHIKKNNGKPITLSDRFTFVADGNLLSGSTKDVYLSRFLAMIVRTPDSIYNPLFSKYDKIVHNKQLKQLVIDRRNDYTNPVRSNDNNFASLDEIFKKYKGKIIYIDFWASWCIPCRGEMPMAAELKKKLTGKDVVFLYFGYDDKEKAWLKAREQLNVEGEHYLLNEKLAKEAETLFEIKSIPHYAIIDKNGDMINKNADRPADVYTQLLTLLQK